MALSNQQLQDRVESIELLLTDVQTALLNLVTKVQMKALSTVRQNEIQDLQERVTSLESQIRILQSS